jgi:hypothetical protein
MLLCLLIEEGRGGAGTADQTETPQGWQPSAPRGNRRRHQDSQLTYGSRVLRSQPPDSKVSKPRATKHNFKKYLKGRKPGI